MTLSYAQEQRIDKARRRVYRDELTQEYILAILDLEKKFEASSGEERTQIDNDLIRLNKGRSIKSRREVLEDLMKKYNLRTEVTSSDDSSSSSSDEEEKAKESSSSEEEKEEVKKEEKKEIDDSQAKPKASPVKKVTPKKLPMSGAGAGAEKEKEAGAGAGAGAGAVVKTKPRLRKAKSRASMLSDIPGTQPASNYKADRLNTDTESSGRNDDTTTDEETTDEENTEEEEEETTTTDSDPYPSLDENTLPETSDEDEPPSPSLLDDPPPPPPQPPQQQPPPPPPPPQEPPQPQGGTGGVGAKVSQVQDELMLDPLLNPPSKKLGKSLQDLSVAEINKDLDYFYKTFGNRLKKLKRSRSKNIQVLRRFYKRVLALLRVDKDKEDKQIGIIIKGSDFIKDKLKEIILENSIDGLTAKDLLINIEGDEDKDKADAGKYEFKTNPTTGKKYAQGEPVERLIPTQEEKQIREVHSDHTPSSYKRKPSRIPNPKTMYRGQEVTARKMVQANPFLTARQPTIKLKTIY